LDGDEVISVSELKEGIHSLQHILGLDFSESDVEDLVRHCDTDGDGSINYHGESTLTDSRRGRSERASERR